MQLVSVIICTCTNVSYVTYQDSISTLCDTGLVGNLTCQPSPCLIINFCFPTCLIPTEIKFVVLCEKIDFKNKALPYTIKVVSHIVTIMYFMCCCIDVADFLYSYLEPAPIAHPLCNVIIVFSTPLTATIHCASGSNLETIPHN